MANEWRDHPRLKGRFLPDHPDDLQVVVHDGGPRLSRNPAEVVWVTVTGMDGETFRGRLLNQPVQLNSVRQGSEIQFIAAEGSDHLLMVTEKYLQERPDWFIQPCNKCGFSELFDAPSDLIRAVFPNLPSDGILEMFSSFCPQCGGVQVVKFQGDPEAYLARTKPTRRPWWKFW